MHQLRAAILLFALASLAVPVEKPPPGRPDALPDGAIRRLGTLQLRHAGLGAFALLPDGKSLVSAGSDGVLRYWDADTGRATRTATLPERYPEWVRPAFSADGTTLAVQGRNEIHLLDAATGKPRTAIKAPGANAFVLALSADGKMLTQVTGDRTSILVWETTTGEVRATLPLPNPNLGSDFHLILSPNGKFLAFGGYREKRPLQVFDVPHAKLLYSLPDAAAVAISPDGKHLVTTGYRAEGREAVLRRFDLATGTETAVFAIGAKAPIALTFSADGRHLACTDPGIVGRILDARDGKQVHSLPGRVLAPRFTPDGKTLLCRDGYGPRLRIWDLAAGRERHPQGPDLARHLALSPDGRTLAAVGWGVGDVHLWDTTTGRARSLDAVGKEAGDVRGLAFAPDGKSVLATYSAGKAIVWDTATGRGRERVLDEPVGGRGRSYRQSFRPSADGRTFTDSEILATQSDTKVQLWQWEAATGKLVRSHTVDYFWSYRRLPDGATLVTAEQFRTVFRDADTAAERFVLADETSGTGSGTSSRDGRLFAAAVARGQAEPGAKTATPDHVRVWEVATNRPLALVATGFVSGVELMSDHRRLVLLDGNTLRVVDLATGKEVLRRALPLPGKHRRSGWDRSELAVSADGRRAVTSQPDGTALVWDLETKTPPLEARPPTEAALARWWADLGQDAPVAYAALWRLRESPEVALALLRRHLAPAAFSAVAFQRLLADLDAEDFKVREAAERSLQDLGDLAVRPLRKVLQQPLSVEVRARVQKILSRPRGLIVGPGLLRQFRAVQLLESLDSMEARRLLRDLSRGDAEAELTRAATAALIRLGEGG